MDLEFKILFRLYDWLVMYVVLELVCFYFEFLFFIIVGEEIVGLG